MKEEWKSILNSTWIKVVLIAIVLIPMVYAGVFLGSMWDPYGNADHIPVAVVNLDESVNFQDHQLRVGDDLVQNLKENKAMDFQFVDENSAKVGLANGNYYMVITIPNDFSNNATTLFDQEPKQMILQYETNPGTNYIASKMDESAIRSIKEKVNESVIETYVDTMLSQVATVSDGLKEASNGSARLEDGVSKTMDGNQTITSNLSKLAESTVAFQEGSDSLQIGFQAYREGVSKLSEGAKQEDDGMHLLQANTASLSEGVKSLSSGSDSLKTGITSYGDGVDKVASALNQIVASNDAIRQGSEQLAQGSTQVKQGSESLQTGLQTMSHQLHGQWNEETQAKTAQLISGNEQASAEVAAYLPSLQAKIDAHTATVEEQQLFALLSQNETLLNANTQAITTLSNGLQEVQGSVDQALLPGAKQLHQGLVSLDAGINGETGLNKGIQTYTSAITEIEHGTNSLKETTPILTQGVSTLTNGLTQLTGKIPTLETGIQALSTGADEVYSGSRALNEKSAELKEGILKLSNGSVQIASGANQLASGSNTLQTGLEQVKNGTSTLTNSLLDGANQSNLTTNEKTKQMFASPVQVEHQEISSVESNGKAMAPYMMSVGLYVACMAFTLMYPLLKNQVDTKSGWKLWLSKASVMYSVSTLMAVIMVSALCLINKLAPLELLPTYGVAILVAASFMSFIVFFNITCGKVGAFLVLVFMVFQLGGAAGTYPIETSNQFYQIIHPFMPFTYSVDAFRHTLALGGSLQIDCLVFSSLLFVFSLLSIRFYRWYASIGEEKYAKTRLAQFH